MLHEAATLHIKQEKCQKSEIFHFKNVHMSLCLFPVPKTTFLPLRKQQVIPWAPLTVHGHSNLVRIDSQNRTVKTVFASNLPIPLR